VQKRIFAVLYVSVMGLTRCYKTTVFLHLFILSPDHSWTTLYSHIISHMHQTKPRRKCSMLPSVTTHIVFQVRHDVGRCVRSGSCSLTSLKWNVNGQYWWDVLQSQQRWAVTKHVIDDNIIYLSATQLMHAPADGARNTVQQLLCKTLSFISPDSWAMIATGQSATKLIIRFRESTAAWIWVASQPNWRNKAAIG